MITIYAKHKPYTDGHLAKVQDEMELTGAPTIRCVEFDGAYFALEGSHRLKAAHEQKLEPKIILFKFSDVGLDGNFWRHIWKRLPHYEFEHVHIIDGE